MLTNLEANWLYLENELIEYVGVNAPELIPDVERWIELIRPLPIAEKTLHFGQLCELLFEELATLDEKLKWKNVKEILVKENKVKDVQVLNIFEKTIDSWISFVRKEVE
ncbi:hypothetical protein [Bacillus cereus group sp. BY6-1LC]|uniref:hypothetical protein n=1 Tax=Bacillus cereus group sp. BY6-1LC TaxID=3018077 RepID=UPI0022E15097|nr:hypothetical protein [Bacillus cereus group sp. BY6-1LC]MDA1800405.1 hypothetical protein [Bacillus cereus group sp. BY6-1LC]